MLTIKTTQELVNKLAIMVRNYDAFTNCIDDYNQLLSAEARNNTLAKEFVALCQANGIEADENTCFLFASEYNIAYAQQTLEEVLAEYVATHATNETVNPNTTNPKEETIMTNNIPVIPVAPATEAPKFRSPMIPVAHNTDILIRVLHQCLRVQYDSKKQKAKNYISEFMVESCVNYVLHGKYTKFWNAGKRQVCENKFTDEQKTHTQEVKAQVLASDVLVPYKGAESQEGKGYIIKAKHVASYYTNVLKQDVVYRFTSEKKTQDYLIDGSKSALRAIEQYNPQNEQHKIFTAEEKTCGYRFMSDVVNTLDDTGWLKVDTMRFERVFPHHEEPSVSDIIYGLYQDTEALKRNIDVSAEERKTKATALFDAFKNIDVEPLNEIDTFIVMNCVDVLVKMAQ